MTTDLASGFNFPTRGHRPVKQRVESRDTHTAYRWFNVFEKRRKTPDDFSCIQLFGHPTEFFQRYTGFTCARDPWRWLDFLRRELALQGKQNVPFMLAELDL